MADFRCSAESLLAAAEGAVKSEKNKHGGEPTARVVIYLPVDKAARLTRRAKAAGVSRSAFIADLVNGYQHNEYPALAGLAHVIAIYEVVRASRTATTQQIDHLRALVANFAVVAGEEASSDR